MPVDKEVRAASGIPEPDASKLEERLPRATSLELHEKQLDPNSLDDKMCVLKHFRCSKSY
jgi:hypothetical protein